MCGIFAYIQKGNLSSRDSVAINEHFARIKHRGPDHTSFIILKGHGCTIFLGFHRLAIIDPSEISNSFLHEDSVYLVCNGEIYNYNHLIEKYGLTVRTGSDCEVILQLYKQHYKAWPTIIEELDGDFAFALYDHNKGIMLASRDRMGVRPLFEAVTPEYAAFASEGKAIPFIEAKPFQPGLFKHIKLTHDKLLTIEKSWLKSSALLHVGYTSAQNVIRELLTESVRKRLMSDRPIGFLVSGGLDSSLVAAIAHRLLGKRITTFSIGLADSPDLVAASKVAAFLDSDHHEVIISTTDIIEALPEVIYHDETYDTTTIRASIPMYLISKYISEHTDIKVIFSGEGADELFGGYLYFHKAPSYKAFQDESERLMKELYKYDVLRSDRSTSAWGLELRVPFLDADLLSFVTNIGPEHKMPQAHGIEKAILRESFKGYLPEEILFRQKEAFSDGVGHGSVGALKKHAENKVCTTEYFPNSAKPKTQEAKWYYTLFKEWYAERPGLYTEYYWMPLWHENVTDPSATVLDTHKGN